MAKEDHLYAVIMAGGSGTRMWPMSRKNSPKQFHTLFSAQTMLQLMYQLLREVFTPEHIFVQTDKKFLPYIEEQLPELPKGNVLREPEARDTAPAFGFATAALLRRDPAARLGVFYSDHIVKGKEEFIRSVKLAFQAVEDFPRHIVMVGVKPTYPHSGLGYIKIKSEAKTYPEGEVFHVARFVEKPDEATAEKFVRSWEYFWNTGYKIYQAQHLLELMATLDKAMARTLEQIARRIDEEGNEEKIARLYGKLPRISFEYLATEKLSDLLVVPSDMEWSDIGDWKSLHNMLVETNGHHMITKGHHIGVNCERCLIFGGERMIATLGIKDTIIVDTGDVILIADKDAVQADMKQLIATLEEQDKHVYL